MISRLELNWYETVEPEEVIQSRLVRLFLVYIRLDPVFVGLIKFISQSPTNMSTTSEYARTDWLMASLLTPGVGESLSHFPNPRMQGRAKCVLYASTRGYQNQLRKVKNLETQAFDKRSFLQLFFIRS